MEIQVQGNLTTVLIVLSQIVMTLLSEQPLKLLYKKDVLKKFAKSTGKHLSRSRFSFLIKLQALGCEFSEVFKNTYFTEYLQDTVLLLHFIKGGKKYSSL